MDLKCLIKLLLEKGYIEEELIKNVNDDTVSVRYKFEHIEIFKKIKNSEYDKNIIFIEKSRYSKNKFYILNSINLEKLLIELGKGREKFGFRADKNSLGCINPHKLVDIINNKTRFNVTHLETQNQIYMDICDTYLKEQRIKQEAEREAEILDFLDKLP